MSLFPVTNFSSHEVLTINIISNHVAFVDILLFKFKLFFFNKEHVVVSYMWNLMDCRPQEWSCSSILIFLLCYLHFWSYFFSSIVFLGLQSGTLVHTIHTLFWHHFCLLVPLVHNWPPLELFSTFFVLFFVCYLLLLLFFLAL